MRTAGRCCLFLTLTCVLASSAAAQFGRGPGMRPPEIRGVLTPTEGAGAVYQSSAGQVEISLVGKEDVGGKPGYWIQIGVMSPEGQMYLKQLRVMDGNNSTIARVIMQPPQGNPMEMPAGMFGPTTSSDARAGKLIGKESITTPAGTFNCDHYQADDKSWDTWVAPNVPPFGVVKSKDDAGEMTLLRTVTGITDHVKGDFGLKPAWTIKHIPDDAVAAFNAGQFIGGIPWGWLVLDGVEQKPPGSGPVAMSFVIDRSGRVALVTPAELPDLRAGARFAFQSYPALLVGDGEMPWELRAPGRGVNLAHRDSRLAIGIRRNGEIIVALTRFAVVGSAAGSLPWGPTVQEMAAFMRALGAERAMMLDGGISSQLAIRGRDGVVKRWANWRPVPLAVIATSRPHAE